MNNRKVLIIDFDSTFVKTEGLEELAEIALAGRDDKDVVMEKIVELTNKGMEGVISFDESLLKRVAVLNARKEHMEELVVNLREKISDSVKKNREFFENNAKNIYILSGGFKDFVVPVVSELGVLAENVFANNFVFDGEGRVVGVDKCNPLSRSGGKVKVIRENRIDGEIYVVGDGYSDYEVKEAGLAEKFLAFTENVRRDSVVDKADMEVGSFDEVIGIFEK